MATIVSLASKYNEAFDLKLFLLTKAPITFRELSRYFFQHGFNLRAPNLVFLRAAFFLPTYIANGY